MSFVKNFSNAKLKPNDYVSTKESVDEDNFISVSDFKAQTGMSRIEVLDAGNGPFVADVPKHITLVVRAEDNDGNGFDVSHSKVGIAVKTDKKGAVSFVLFSVKNPKSSAKSLGVL